MSLVGARDMSIIETPPAERFPVQSYVVEDSEVVLKNAIRRELRRGGQVYFVYNRVESIDLMRQRLEDLVPEARIQTGHGQMAEELLERVMVDFYEGRYDILLATSIVENGLDVANANTIIVYNADQFGLSQIQPHGLRLLRLSGGQGLVRDGGEASAGDEGVRRAGRGL